MKQRKSRRRSAFASGALRVRKDRVSCSVSWSACPGRSRIEQAGGRQDAGREQRFGYRGGASSDSAIIAAQSWTDAVKLARSCADTSSSTAGSKSHGYSQA